MTPRPAARAVVLLSLLYVAITTGFLIVYAPLAESPAGGDTYQHLSIARWAFAHPDLLLHHWGKPVYTLFVAPFARLGLPMAIVAQLGVVGAAAYCGSRVARRTGGQPEVAAVLYLAAPITLVAALGLTPETLFAGVLAAATWQALDEHPHRAALIASLLPLIRTEGVLLLPVFAAFLAHRRAWRSTPLLLMTLLVYSLLGAAGGRGVLWLATELPYSPASDAYGAGSPLHYPLRWPVMFGVMSTALLAAGVMTFRRTRNAGVALVLALIGTYTAAHIAFWTLGVASMGLLRYFAAIAPLVAVLGAYGVAQFEFRLLGVFPAFEFLLLLAVGTGVLLAQGYRGHEGPVMVQAVEIARVQDDGGRVVYYDPRVPVLFGFDPYDEARACFMRGAPCEPLPGDLVIWDAHFGRHPGVPHAPFRRGSLLHVAETGAASLGRKAYRVEVWRIP